MIAPPVSSAGAGRLQGADLAPTFARPSLAPGLAPGPLTAELLARIQRIGRTRYEKQRWLPYQLLQFPAELRDGLLDEFEALVKCQQHLAASMYFFELRADLALQADRCESIRWPAGPAPSPTGHARWAR